MSETVNRCAFCEISFSENPCLPHERTKVLPRRVLPWVSDRYFVCKCLCSLRGDAVMHRDDCALQECQEREWSVVR